MVFSSAFFLYFFLLLALALYYLVWDRYKNITLLFISLAFYFVGEKSLVILMGISIFINYLGGFLVYKFNTKSNYNKWILSMFVLLNLGLLFYYKYLIFALDNFHQVGLFKQFVPSAIIMPIGISFFTFQGVSYLVDVYRKPILYEKSIIKVSLYIALFPQLIAGPIVRYHDVADQIKNRTHHVNRFVEGVLKFIRGFAKKVIIANTLGEVATRVFQSDIQDLPSFLAWLGILLYTLQIYFDFSGYSDMAIGLGKMFGFEFQENFRHPYISRSIREFWRRWHISLSQWFKDYVYIPLGGNRVGEMLVYRNLILVFLATGIWHGASWNFILWGLYYGLFLILERIINWSFKIPNFIKNIYVLGVVIMGWVLFKIENIHDIIIFLKKMFIWQKGSAVEALLLITPYTIFVTIIAVFLSTPLRQYINIKMEKHNTKISYLLTSYTFYLFVFFWGLIQMAQSSFNPFIYFRF